MYTVKIETFVRSDDTKEWIPAYHIFEMQNIYRETRSFINKDVCNEWYTNIIQSSVLIVGGNILSSWDDGKIIPDTGIRVVVLFGEDKNGESCNVVSHNCRGWIMNESGQTVDSFSI